MTQSLQWLNEKLGRLYDRNPYVGVLQIAIETLSEGECALSMPIQPEIHTNLFGVAHGGALASLADTAMGVCCATLYKRVVTIDMNINYMQSAPQGQRIRAKAWIIHNGNNTMVLESEILSGSGELLAKARGTFFVVGDFDLSHD